MGKGAGVAPCKIIHTEGRESELLCCTPDCVLVPCSMRLTQVVLSSVVYLVVQNPRVRADGQVPATIQVSDTQLVGAVGSPLNLSPSQVCNCVCACVFVCDK